MRERELTIHSGTKNETRGYESVVPGDHIRMSQCEKQYPLNVKLNNQIKIDVNSGPIKWLLDSKIAICGFVLISVFGHHTLDSIWTV